LNRNLFAETKIEVSFLTLSFIKKMMKV